MKYLFQPPINCCKLLQNLAIFGSSIASSFENAQNSFTIKGTVRFASVAHPIPDETILFKNSDIGTFTNIIEIYPILQTQIDMDKTIEGLNLIQNPNY